MFVYAQHDGRLDPHLSGDRKAMEPLQAIFAETILKCDELPADPTDTRVYNLLPMRRKDFNFTWDAASGIESVRITKLRLTLNKDKKLTLEANPKHDPKAVYALLDKLAPVLPSHEYQISQVGITATVKPDPKAPGKTVTFQVTYRWPAQWCSGGGAGGAAVTGGTEPGRGFIARRRGSGCDAVATARGLQGYQQDP